MMMATRERLFQMFIDPYSLISVYAVRSGTHPRASPDTDFPKLLQNQWLGGFRKRTQGNPTIGFDPWHVNLETPTNPQNSKSSER